MNTIDITDKDLMLISNESSVAQSFIGTPCKAILLYDGGLGAGYFQSGKEFSFHISKSGSFELEDKYAFGIRANHFTWSEGECEGVETFWKTTKNPEDLGWPPCIIVSGNHKGSFVMQLIVKNKDLNKFVL